MKSFIQYYTTEAVPSEDEPVSLNIFDIDDTLFKTTARIMIKDKKTGKTRDLSSSEYNHYKPADHEEIDYSQFRSAKKFYLESQPIKHVFKIAKEILQRSQYNAKNRVIILTARQDLDDRNMFLATFKKYGFDIDKVRVERAGNMSGPSSIEEKKAIIVNKYLKTNIFNVVRFFDDSEANIRAFMRLGSTWPGIKFEAFHVKENGDLIRVNK